MRPQGKRAWILVACAVALLVCLIALHFAGAHPLWATLVPIVTLLALLAAVPFHPAIVRLWLQPLSFLSLGGNRAPPSAWLRICQDLAKPGRAEARRKLKLGALVETGVE
jgi:hypothetical protein